MSGSLRGAANFKPAIENPLADISGRTLRMYTHFPPKIKGATDRTQPWGTCAIFLMGPEALRGCLVEDRRMLFDLRSKSLLPRDADRS